MVMEKYNKNKTKELYYDNTMHPSDWKKLKGLRQGKILLKM